MQITTTTGPPMLLPAQEGAPLSPQATRAAETPRPVLQPVGPERPARDPRMRRQRGDSDPDSPRADDPNRTDDLPASPAATDSRGHLLDVLA